MRNFTNLLISFCIVLMTSCGSFGEGLLMGLTSMGSYPSYSGSSSAYSNVGYTGTSGNMNYLLDPNYAIQQVLQSEEQEYQTYTYYNKKPDGSNYTKSEWMTMKGQAIQNSQSNGSKSSGYSSSSSYDSSSSMSSSSMEKRCKKLSVSDIAHCNGSGVCQKCNGKGKYYDTALGNNNWVDPCVICKGSGKCPSCNGKGYRY